MRRAFYTLGDRRYFLGIAALVNSLRLLGHREPIHVLDFGLTAGQRALLAPEVELVPAPPGSSPLVGHFELPLDRPAAAMVMLDSDVIATRSLEPIFRLVEGGKLVVPENDKATRFFREWETLLDTPPLRRGTYVNLGLYGAGPGVGAEALELAASRLHYVDLTRSQFGSGTHADPLHLVDQDVWNAVLMSSVDEQHLEVLEYRLAPHPPFLGLRLVDAATLDCRYEDGTRPFVLHHTLHKPWLDAVRRSPYSRLMGRLLLSPDVAVRLSPGDVPPRLRGGALGFLDQGVADVRALGRASRGRLGVRRRIDARIRARRTRTPG